MENFDIKSRGLHQGTSAIQRAEVNLDDLGRSDFLLRRRLGFASNISSDFHRMSEPSPNWGCLHPHIFLHSRQFRMNRNFMALELP